MSNALFSPDEKELVLSLTRGDRNAFDRLYHFHKRQIYNKLRTLLHSDTDAEELLQEVFFKLWVRRDLLDPEKSFSAYLYRIAANLVYDHFRKITQDKKLQQHLVHTASELYEHVETLLNYKESNEQLQKLIDALPPQRRKVFSLCKIEGKSYEEVSTVLGISTSTVNDHIVKATRFIKEQFSECKETAVYLLAAYLLYYH